MPFTLDGQWVPNKKPVEKNQKPVKVRCVKRGKSILTVILNLSLNDRDLTDLAAKIKKKLGCGGSVKENTIEIQGDNVIKVVEILKEEGIKSS